MIGFVGRMDRQTDRWTDRHFLNLAQLKLRKIGYSSKKRGISNIWYCETDPTRIQNHVRDEADPNSKIGFSYKKRFSFFQSLFQLAELRD